MTRVRAVALGYQGFGNVGDEAILSGIEQLLDGTGIDVRAVIAGPHPVAAFPEAIRVPTRHMRPSFAAIRGLRRGRLLLISGGGLLHDHWATVVPTYLGWVILGRLLGMRVAWLGVGVGPLRRGWARRLAALALRWSQLVTVRDAASAELVLEIAPSVDVAIIPDPAIFTPPPVAAERSGVGVIVRRPAPADAGLAGPLAGALGEAVAALQARGQPVVVLTFGGAADRPFADEVGMIGGRDGTRPAIEELPPDPEMALDRLSRLEAVVSVRLHGLILGAVAGTPSVTVAYDPKVASWAARLGLARYCLGVESMSATDVLAALDGVRAPDAGRQMAERLADLRGEADRVRGLLAGLT